jgi:hypothetical protein
MFLEPGSNRPRNFHIPQEEPIFRRAELDATPVEAQERRERIQWQIRRDKKRVEELRAKLGDARETSR